MLIANQQAESQSQFTLANNRVRLRTIALPAEHGGWAFLFEPIALGLLLAPSVAGFYLALGAIGFFLARQPMTLVILNRKRQSARVPVARKFAAIYLTVGVAGFTAAAVFAHHSLFVPLLIAAPLASIQVTYEWAGRRRFLIAELAGAIAISSLVAAITGAAGWSNAASFALWGLMMARAVAAIIYVRAILGKLHRQSPSFIPVALAHAMAIAVSILLMRAGLAPKLATVATIVLFARALVCFAMTDSRRLNAKRVGFSEVAFGAMTVLAVAIGCAFRW